MSELNSSTRRVLKATYVPLTVDTALPPTSGAVQKYGFVRHLGLQSGEVKAARAALAATRGAPTSPALWKKLKLFEGNPLAARLPPISVFAGTAPTDLVAFGNALISVRQDQYNKLRETAIAVPAAAARLARPTTARRVPAGASSEPPVASPEAAISRAAQALSTEAAIALLRLNTSLVATSTFSQSVGATPIGMLNLERLEMTPAGVERGELLATIPLAPLEQTAVVQKEWSVTTKEFTSIVTDSLENYSETGVTENTELAQSTTAQTQHCNEFNVNATVSGSIGFVTGTVASGFTAQDQNSNSATDSTRHAITTTKKASARVKQEHKVTVSTMTAAGTSETTTRNLQNPSKTDPMRIDYFSLMRKWHVGLYRYGLRLTYDIVIPQPGATMREAYMRLAELQAEAAQGFTFPVSSSDITRATWPAYAAQYQVNLPVPPEDTKHLSFISSYTVQQERTFTFFTMELSLPDGYVVSSARLTGNQAVGRDPLFPEPFLNVMHVGEVPPPPIPQDSTASLDFLAGLSGRQYVVYGVSATPSGVIEVDIQLKLTDSALAAWQQQAAAMLYTTAQNAYYANQQSVQAQIQTLQDRLNNVDTLTLRREENDEIMRGVLRWLLGPGFDFMPKNVRALFSGTEIAWGIGFKPNELGPLSESELDLSISEWSRVCNYEQMVRFVNDALDWDNILYFLYSYFWDIPDSWGNIRNIQHPDATRQAFLRAGSARVVLTVRKGWETDWVRFVESGDFGRGALAQSHPYLAVAQEIQDYDNRNYPGIPTANPGGGIPPDNGQYVATTSGDKLVPSNGPLVLEVGSSTGFIAGCAAIVDSWDSGAQETQSIVAVPDATHLTLKALRNAHDGSSTRFAIRQAGEKGLLIAEWFEHTPTAGTDIAVTSNLATIA